MASRNRRVFFFPHALHPGPGRPGRVRFQANGFIVSASGVRAGRCSVWADGFEDDVVGPNQDPCIFSAPIGPVHTFCRINGTKRGDLVKEVNRNDRRLPECVSSGDIVVYGKFEPRGGSGPTKLVWVDTVLVVEKVVGINTSFRESNSPCNPNCRPKFYTFAPLPILEALTRRSCDWPMDEDLYYFNLSDADPLGTHCCTALKDYRMIVGTSNPTIADLENLTTSFVPTVQNGEMPISISAATMPMDHWNALVDFIDHQVRPAQHVPQGGWIAEFPTWVLGESVCRCIIERAREVAIPPLLPWQLRGKRDPRTNRLVPR